MNTKIIIATHKDRPLLNNEMFLPVQVNAQKSGYIIDPDYIPDNTGDHISEKNFTFNELTALYWAWKNLKDYSVFGLMHYRRYLDVFYKKPLFKKETADVIDPITRNSPKLARLGNVKKTKRIIEKHLEKYDLIVARPAFCSINEVDAPISADYKHNHIAEDWDICMEIIREEFPEYTNSIEKYLDKGNTFYIGNMFIASKMITDEYCKWLFTVLFKTEERIKISEDPYQQRVIGFLSERLFTLYILHHRFRLKELPVLLVQ